MGVTGQELALQSWRAHEAHSRGIHVGCPNRVYLGKLANGGLAWILAAPDMCCRSRPKCRNGSSTRARFTIKFHRRKRLAGENP